MKDILIIIMSALLGYIVLSAFSISGTPEEAFKRIQQLQQPQIKTTEELEIESIKEQAKLQNEIKTVEVQVGGEVSIAQSNNKAKVETVAIKTQGETDIEKIKAGTTTELKDSDNKMLIIISFLIFILVYVYLRYQKNLAQVELEREREHNNMLAKKEYAERILAIVANGNVSIETEHKLLRILDELNNPQLQAINQNGAITHPNPDIEQLEFQRTI